MTIYRAVSIRFTKPVIGLSNYAIGAAIKYTGHPGRRFLAASPLVFAASPLVFAASPLCVFAFKLLKPPSYAGYFLPKIHKPNNPGRPAIVSACSCPTELISSYLDKIMAPIVRSLPSYVKDTQHALQIFRGFNFLGEDKLIFTTDITSLYFLIAKVFYPSNIFLIYVVLRNQARKHCSA